MASVIVSNRGASYLASTGSIARRTWLKFLRTPQLVVVGTIQGAMFLLIFRYVFGGAIIVAPGFDYKSFLIPGFITTGIIFGGMASAAGIAEDLEQGFFDRLRSLPIPRGSVIAGRAVADTATATWGLVIMTVIGFLVGFRTHVPIPEALLGFAMLIVYSFVFEWIFITLGLYAGNAQAAQGMSLLLVPFVFVSSGFVPADKMPSGLRWVAEHQPVTYMVESVRTLTVGSKADQYLHHGASYFLIRALLSSVVLVAIFAPIAINRYRKG
ncbi:MAG: ABC transporter permease [Actinomycetota bacterium]